MAIRQVVFSCLASVKYMYDFFSGKITKNTSKRAIRSNLPMDSYNLVSVQTQHGKVKLSYYNWFASLGINKDRL